MDGLVYFTQRTVGNGNIVAWAYRKSCPKCNKALMGKPVDAKGKVKIRAKEYQCPACGYTVEQKAYEESLTCSCIYTCPSCGHKGEAEVPFKRKKIEGVETIRFQCAKCQSPIDITKKMKEKGKKE